MKIFEPGINFLRTQKREIFAFLFPLTPLIMILKPTPEMPEQAQQARKGSSILNRQSSKQSHQRSDHRFQYLE